MSQLTLTRRARKLGPYTFRSMTDQLTYLPIQCRWSARVEAWMLAQARESLRLSKYESCDMPCIKRSRKFTGLQNEVDHNITSLALVIDFISASTVSHCFRQPTRSKSG